MERVMIKITTVSCYHSLQHGGLWGGSFRAGDP